MKFLYEIYALVQKSKFVFARREYAIVDNASFRNFIDLIDLHEVEIFKLRVDYNRKTLFLFFGVTGSVGGVIVIWEYFNKEIAKPRIFNLLMANKRSITI